MRLLATGVVLALLGVGFAAAGAASANISHSYSASGTIKVGSLVSLDPARSGAVVPSNVNNGSKLLGIAVDGNDSLVALDATPGSVQVATTGIASALVSTLNGDIKVGDQIGVSPFNGVGMKSEPGTRIIGLAQTDFSGSTPGATEEQVKDKTGKTRTIRIGYARVDIAISNDTTTVPSNLNSLQKLAKSLTGRTLPTERVILSLAVVIIAMLSLVTLVYASIYGSIVSIGRNPLAKYAVFRTLGSVLGLGLLTTIIAGVIIYFMLK